MMIRAAENDLRRYSMSLSPCTVLHKVIYIMIGGGEKAMTQTPEYTRRAINNYRDKFDFIHVRFPKGTRERLEGKGNINDYIVKCVLDSLENCPKTRMESTHEGETRWSQ